MQESDLQKQIINYLIANDYFVIRLNSGRKGKYSFLRYFNIFLRKFETSGISDLLVFKKNNKSIGYFIELKRNSKLGISEKQTEFKKNCDYYNIINFKISSLEELKNKLKEF